MREINLLMPVTWTWRHFWWQTKRRAMGLVVAFQPRMLIVGAEIITGDCTGFSIYIGPLWLAVVSTTAK
ncbi:MAG: hypothetical protein WBL20_17090 [Sphingobium sp.]|uniref:hypothetical protein n=1 Tax=Sphingobium sp. TaxID=1912891 RepID=UPI003BAF946C